MHDATTLCELYTRTAVGFTSSYRKSLNCLCALSNDDLQRGGRYADQGIRPTSNGRKPFRTDCGLRLVINYTL